MMSTVNLPLYSWMWVYNPRASPPEGDKLENRKLAVHWVWPYRFEGMKTDVMD